MKDIATADTVAVFTDPSIAAVATYEPYMSQAVKISGRETPRCSFPRRIRPASSPTSSRSGATTSPPIPRSTASSCAVYIAPSTIANKEPKKFAELVAPNFNLNGPEVEEMLAGGVVYTQL